MRRRGSATRLFARAFAFGVQPKRLVGMLLARPLADHQQVPRIVDVDQQLVAQVAREARHVPPDRFGHRTPLPARGAGNRDSQMA